MATTANRKEFAAELEQLKQRVRSSLSDKKVLEFIRLQLAGRAKVRAEQLELTATEDLLKLILAVIKTDESNLPYRISYEQGYLTVNGFRIPDLIIEQQPDAAKQESGGTRQHVDG